MDLATLINKFTLFAEQINERDFRPYQKKRAFDIIKAVILNEGATLTNLWARQSGKTEMVKAVALSLMCLLPGLADTAISDEFQAIKLYKFGFQIAIAGPKLSTAQIPFNRLRRQLRRNNFTDILTELEIEVVTSNSLLFELSNGSVAQAFSGSETASNEGPGADLLLIDEAAMLSQYSYYKILRPMVAANNGTICQTGTPWKRRCPFLTDIEYNKRNKPDYHYEVPYTTVIKESKQYASFIEEEIRRLPNGIDNPFFQMNYLLQWMLVQGHFVSFEQFSKIGLKERFRGPDVTYCAGVDWGKIVSATVAVIIAISPRGYMAIDAVELWGDYDSQFDILIPFLKSYNCQSIFAEAVGSGDPLCDRLKKEMGGGNDLVQAKYMTAQYKDRIYTQLNTMITGKTSSFFYWDNGTKEMETLTQQFLDVEQEIRGKLLSVHKSNIEGSRDDFTDATALGIDACILTPISANIEIETAAEKREIYKELREFASTGSPLKEMKDF